MTTQTDNYDVIIAGGSYAGLAAAMALGRALRRVLVIDSGLPANRQTPYSHNFITNDGVTPAEISNKARLEVARYKSVSMLQATVVQAKQTNEGFCVTDNNHKQHHAKKLILATGITDILPAIPGFAECWGISVLHCPYCHGYEVRNVPTGVLGNGDSGYDFALLIANWTPTLTLYTNGPATLTATQLQVLHNHHINVCAEKIEGLQHQNGMLNHIVLGNNRIEQVTALYARLPFILHSNLQQQLGCELTSDGYIKTDSENRTTVKGVFACGDNISRMRTVANAVATGTATGILVNKELVTEKVNYSH